MRRRLHISFMQVVRRLIGAVGGVLLSNQDAANLTAQRDRAVMELAVIENRNLEQGLVGIIVSRDRALQLYSLLFTYCELVVNKVPLIVIYAFTTIEHASAYEEVNELFSKLYPDIRFVKEVDCFRDTLINILNTVVAKNVFFLVDDIVFIRNVDLAIASTLDTSRHVLSFRHSPYLTRSYTANRNQMPPTLSRFGEVCDLFEFRWFEMGNEWSDPWSLDGQILSTAEVRVITRVSSFSGPNSYESALKSFNSLCRERLGLCYFESKILNLPINRVQSEYANMSGSVSPEYLLEQWNKGMMLDTTRLRTHIPRSPHEDHVMCFTIRPQEMNILRKLSTNYHEVSK